jgi:nucleoside-diphosphate-sugar epimerase
MAEKPTFSNPVIPAGSLILITGANGLISSHCVDQALAAGYKVRGSVRDVNRCSWMNGFFEKRYGPGLFELVEISDVFKDGYLDDAVKGVAAIIHTVPTNISFMEKEPEPATSNEVKTVISALESAKKEPSVKRFVLTSSAWAAGGSYANKPYTLTVDSWNEDAIQKAYAKDPAPDGLQIFMTLKTRMEQEAWKWVKENNPYFVMNAIFPHTVMGHILDPDNQSLQSTGNLVRVLYNGEPDGPIWFMKWIGPQWFIDTVDCGRLHLIGKFKILHPQNNKNLCFRAYKLIYLAAIDPEVENERIFGHAAPMSWDDILDILRKMFPNKKFIDNFDQGSDIGKVPSERGDELLKKHYGTGWTSLEDCVEANLKSLIKF